MRVWRETFALMGASCWFAAGFYGLVCLIEWATRYLPMQPWQIGDLIA